MTRPRLQLHLSTLLIVTVLAAGLVWLNVRPQDMLVADCEYTGWNVSGFPFNYQEFYDHDGSYKAYANWSNLALNCGICLGLLAVSAVAIEWFTRRMKRKPTL